VKAQARERIDKRSRDRPRVFNQFGRARQGHGPSRRMASRVCPSTASLPEASTRFCVMPPRESYFEATGHSRGRAIFRASSASSRRWRSVVLFLRFGSTDGAHQERGREPSPKDVRGKFSCWPFDGSGARSALAEGLSQPAGPGNPSDSRNRDQRRHRPRTDCHGEPDQHWRTIPTVPAPRTARMYYSDRGSG
jgi:hypothetical protein